MRLPPKPGAFTLVEILVVIATLALLLALLMPALAGARSQARTMVCRSNLHQLVLAGAAYAAENDGFYVPAARDLWDNAGRQRWHGVRSRLDAPFDPRKGRSSDTWPTDRSRNVPPVSRSSAAAIGTPPSSRAPAVTATTWPTSAAACGTRPWADRTRTRAPPP